MDKDLFKKLASTAMSVEQIRSSVMQPLLWMVGIACPLFFSAAYLMPAYQQILIMVPIVMVIFFAFVYLCFAIRNPDRLQSEQYQLKRFEMQVQAMQGLKGPEIVDDKTLSHNPEVAEKKDTQS